MPDERFAVPNVRARGRWRARTVDGGVTLFVESSEVVVRLDEGEEELAMPLASLSGAAWRASTLSLHGQGTELYISGEGALDGAWSAISRRACRTPEVASGLRSLGARRGGDPALQARFFAPFLQARRRLEEPEPVDRQVKSFDVRALEQRLATLITAVATERYPDLPSHRRALEAELLDAAESLSSTLEALAGAAEAVDAAADAESFVAWRAWSTQVRRVFVEADRSWATIVSILASAR